MANKLNILMAIERAERSPLGSVSLLFVDVYLPFLAYSRLHWLGESSMRWKRDKRTTLPTERYEVELRRDQITGVIVSETWLQGGKLNRQGGPAIVIRDATTDVILDEKWFLNNQLHREDGPAEVLRKPDGRVYHSAWYKNGEKVPAPPRAQRGRQLSQPMRSPARPVP
jgi:hypothetical protein